MGDVKGYIKIKRQKSEYRPVCDRVRDYLPVAKIRPDAAVRDQASRCMDCGTPFCHWGCPLGNYIPEWNDVVYQGKWEKAFELLDATNNLPEITGRICPAPCEYACVLGINDDPVTIREDELDIIEHAFRKEWIKPNPPKARSGKKVAVVGSGPAGLACAAQLNRAGHLVTVFEKDEKIGGIMRFGIPDFKLEKSILDRRIDLWEKEGIEFKTGIKVGSDYPAESLQHDYDAVCLAGGSRVPRDLKIEGRELKGVCFAMEYLSQSNRRIAGENIPSEKMIDAKGKKVVVIGGGDTGADCVGTANRQGAACVVQIELLPKPSENRPDHQPWPVYPFVFKTSTSHEEGAERKWQISTKKFVGKNGQLTKLSCVQVEFFGNQMKEIAGSEFEIEADLVLLALGFLHPEPVLGLVLECDNRGNIKTDSNFMTSDKGIFSAGDMRRGQSLIVWAIAEGRQAARCMDEYLMGQSSLPRI
jgi:glutamate synthase (NADPH/NADH) small chain